VVVSDILGEFGLFAKTLRNAKIIDEDNHWIGGKAHLVILGNIVGFSQGILPSYNLVRDLEKEASAAGGMVHMIRAFGEDQLLHRDIGVVDPGNYSDLATEDSERRIKEFTEKGVKEVLARFPDAPYPDRLTHQYENMMASDMHPGGVEFLDLFAPGTDLGDWLRSRNIIIQIGDFLFSHGGLSEKHMNTPLRQINDEDRQAVAAATLLVRLDFDLQSPPWWRDLATKPELQMQREVETVLAATKTRAQIVGVSNGLDLPTHYGLGARVFFVDSGMRAYQVHSAKKKLSSLVIEGDRFTMLWDDKAISAPTPGPVPQPVAKTDAK